MSLLNTKIIWLCLGFFILIPFVAICQIGMRTPIPYSDPNRSDSVQIIFPKPVIPIRDWHDMSDQIIKIENETKIPSINRIISPNLMSVDPLKIDTRAGSYYVPRMVRDELNLIMNRPRDSAFMPILPVAYLALQLASKYLIIRQKTEITAEDINNASEALPILRELWLENPLTLTALYKRKEINTNYSMLELERLVALLSDNKLVKPKQVENSETLYFPAIDQSKYDYILERAKTEKLQSDNDSILPKNTINTKPR